MRGEDERPEEWLVVWADDIGDAVIRRYDNEAEAREEWQAEEGAGWKPGLYLRIDPPARKRG
jgi:hypothetical protein